MPAVLFVAPCSECPAVWREATVEPMPLRVNGAASLMRSVPPWLPKTREPPELTVMPDVPQRALSESAVSVPALTIVAPVKVLLPLKTTEPPPIFVIPPAPEIALVKLAGAVALLKETLPSRTIAPEKTILLLLRDEV